MEYYSAPDKDFPSSSIFIFLKNIETPPCEDLEGWCKHEPKCEHEDVQDSCPKLCGTCKGRFLVSCSETYYYNIPIF